MSDDIRLQQNNDGCTAGIRAREHEREAMPRDTGTHPKSPECSEKIAVLTGTACMAVAIGTGVI